MFTATALEIISEKHPTAFHFDAPNMKDLVGISLQTCDIYKRSQIWKDHSFGQSSQL